MFVKEGCLGRLKECLCRRFFLMRNVNVNLMMFGKKYYELLLSMILNYILKIFFNIIDN